MGLAAQAIRVLHAVVTFEVRVANRTSGGQAPVGSGAVDLSRLAAHGVDARIKRAVAAPGSVQRHGPRNHRGFKQTLGAQQRVDGQRRRHLRAIDQRQAFFGRQANGLEARFLQSPGGKHARALKEHFAFANQREAQVRQRRQITRCADRALAGNHRRDAKVVKRQQAINDDLANAGIAACQASGLDQQNQAHHGLCHGLTHTHSV